MKTDYRTPSKYGDSVRIGFVTAIVVMLVFALASLVSQGDICDQAKNPQQCRNELPDR